MIYIASDHAGFFLKQHLLNLNKYSMVDLGPETSISVDYPVYAKKVALALKNNQCDIGVLICGSGVGMAIAVNRFPHIRAVLCYNAEEIQLSRKHNNTNVAVFAGRLQKPEQVQSYLDIFLNTEYNYEERHERRIKMLSEIIL